MSELLISARGLTKRYGDFEAVAGIDFAVAKGESFGLLGPNGAGKSTTMRILSATSQRSSGELSILGLDPEKRGPQVRAHLGVVPQQDNLDTELTVSENLYVYGRYFGLDKKYILSKVDELLSFAQLEDKRDVKVDALSGGMKRRLTIARALISEPDILMLDEPTTGLDPRGRQDMWGVIKGLVAGGTTLLLTTQYLEEADQLADEIVVVDHGKVIARGTSDNLKRQVGGERLEVVVELQDLAKTQAIVAGVASGKVTVEEDLGRVSAPVSTGSRALIDAALKLDEITIHPLDIGLKRPSLDDVFISLTGHAAVESEPEVTPTKRGR